VWAALRSLRVKDAAARGRVSPFEIVLSAAERGELEKRAATTLTRTGGRSVLLAAAGLANLDMRHGLIPARRWFTAGGGGSSNSD
jgi:hypothetical protein